MEELRLRRYRPEDHDRVLELHVAALEATVGYVEDIPAELEADLRDVETHYLDTGGEFLVGERTGKIVAMGGFRPRETRGLLDLNMPVGHDVAELKRMRVDPGHMRNGYGERVLAELESRARNRGFARIVLDTGVGMTGAQSFYETHGYELTARASFRDGEVELVCYEKTL